MINKIYENKRIIISLLAILVFIAVINIVFVLELNILDDINIVHSDSMLFIFKRVTRLGDWYFLILMTLGTLFLKNKKIFKYTAINLGLITLLNQFLKIIIKRPRPIGFDIIDVSGYSFPSGHAMVGMAFYGLFIYFVLKSNQKKLYKILECLALALIIVLIGISRVYLGVHYITDIVGGYSGAIIYLMIYTLLIRKDYVIIDKKE